MASVLGELSHRHMEQKAAKKANKKDEDTSPVFKFNENMMNVMCMCQPNERQLQKQALNKEKTVIMGMPCALGYDETHMLTSFLKD